MESSHQQQEAANWVHTYSDALYGFALKRTNDTHVAKDLVQETFLSAWKNIDQYRGEASVKSWLFVILKSKLIDHYRKAARRANNEVLQKEEQADIYFDQEDHWATSAYPKQWANDAGSRLHNKEFNSIVSQCKSKLKSIQQAVFTMKYLDGLESEEICKTLEITSANYWVIVHRAKVQLRACLETNWFAT